ncbi:SusC/RagA family TonB-linked outer membrane protein [Rudanella paleaurantiibacter]|nr:SusC/RagA family TonB-linked outer membrane protein [Rudanella paleaurantiibacter]
MMDKSYTRSQFVGNVGQVGNRQLQSSGRTTWLSFIAMLTLMVLVTVQSAWAQGQTVSGKVTASSVGIPGVTVQVKGESRGTTTDADGNYRLNNVGGNATLIFSSIGYTSQEVAVGNRTTVDVQLAEDNKTLSEVVVIGYGTQKVKDATGSVVALGSKDFNKGVIASPEQLLQGRAAGIQITPASGEPGAGINIRIRGTASLRSNNNPLFVVDGVPLDGGDVSNGDRNFGTGRQPARNPLNFLNPDDIENISVLKDASAAAIYGARGANGVVLITTRKGKAGAQTLNISANTSISSVLRKYDLLNASEYPDAVRRAGGDPTTPSVNGGASTDWQDAILRTGVSQNYNISYGGGNDNTRYQMSLGYSDQQGVIKKAALRRLTGRINASHELFNDKVVLDLSMTTSGLTDVLVPNGDNAGFQGNLITAAIQANPTYPIRDAQGRFFNPDGYNSAGRPNGNTFRNPVSLLEMIDDQQKTVRTLASLGATWKITDGLSYKMNFGLDNARAERRGNILRNIPGFDITDNAGSAFIQNRTRQSRLIEHTLSYNKKLGVGTIDAVAGFSYQKFENLGSFVAASRFIPEADLLFPYTNNLGGANNLGTNKAYEGGSDRDQSELQSYFGRVNYNIQDKYLLTATVRVDGSSKFGVNNKYGTFPAFAAAWKVSQEEFAKNLGVDIKVRGNWGITGNQEFPSTLTRNRFSFVNSGSGVARDITPNDNLRWEQTMQYGAGVDLGFFDGRLTATVDYFNRNTKDLLFEALYAAPAPARARWINLPANVINSGLEVAVNYDILPQSKLRWDVSANATFLRNRVSNFSGLYNTGEINGQGLTGAFAQRIVNDLPLFSFFMPTFSGYDNNGFGQYTDPSLQLVYQGSAIPTFNFGLTNNFTYGNWSASIFLNGVTGGYIYNNTANAVFTKGNLRNGRNVTREEANSAENALNPPLVSTRFLEKSDFVRLSNLTVGYSLPLKSATFAKSIRFSVTGQNLLLFTNYSGIDPEVNVSKSIDGIPSLGIDYGAFPTARTFTFGVSVGF